MRPKQAEAEPQEDLFRARLANLVDPRHALVRLGALIDWGRLEAEFGPLYTDAIGRPGLPTRLMVGLHLLKHMDGLSEEAVCARYLDSPDVQLFCGGWKHCFQPFPARPAAGPLLDEPLAPTHRR